MATQLTDAEFATLNEAMAIIDRHLPAHASIQVYAAQYPKFGFSPDLTYFDSERGQHSLVTGKTFADKFNTALQFEDSAARDAEVQRTMRIASLRKELSELTGEAA